MAEPYDRVTITRHRKIEIRAEDIATDPTPEGREVAEELAKLAAHEIQRVAAEGLFGVDLTPPSDRPLKRVAGRVIDPPQLPTP